ncbi:MAG: signal recognition particle receptor subunit alpha [Candidatus Paceibacterota bacterium]
MFDFLKKKLKEVFSRTKKDIEEEAVDEKKEIEQEVKEIEKEEAEVVEEIKKIETPEESKTEEKEIPFAEEPKADEEIPAEEAPYEEKGEAIQKSVPEEDIKKEEKPLEEHIEKLEEKKEGFFARLKKTFTTTKITDNDFERFFAELELALIENNVAMGAIDALKKNLKEQLENKEIKRGKIEDEIKSALEKAVSDLLIEPFDLVERIKESVKEKKPFVIAFFGINGVGKTLTIAKISHLLKENGITSIMAASDTFRAAAIEQLEKHAEKLGIEIVKQKYGSDPAAVAYDAISHAKSKGTDVVLIDTAGRINSKANLM